MNTESWLQTRAAHRTGRSGKGTIRTHRIRVRLIDTGWPPMSALGHKRTNHFGPKSADVRCCPKAGIFSGTLVAESVMIPWKGLVSHFLLSYCFYDVGGVLSGPPTHFLSLSFSAS